MHYTTKKDIILSVLGIIVSVLLFFVFFTIKINTEEILTGSSEHSIMVLSGVLGVLIGFVSITKLFSSTKKKEDSIKKKS